VEPKKAMFKTPEGITLHDPALCIGCGACQEACPYSVEKLDAGSLEGASYSVISFNPAKVSPQPRWADKTVAIAGGTPSGADTAARAGATPPMLNRFVGQDVPPVRPADVVEKCTFCYQRTLKGLQPACVEACPSKARVFGDQDDAGSEIAQILKREKSFRLKQDKGTRPNVHYVGKYSARA
jgi:Fe-S-cluster-containing dehydrogenase component